jgi:hypothetical protein
MSKIPDTKKNAEICATYCGSCPTHSGIPGELLFCARGKSQAPKPEAGCYCDHCEIWNSAGLKDHYYCRNGAAK